MASRLNALGAEEARLKAVTYIRVFGPIDDAGIAWLADLVGANDQQLAIVDSASESLAAEGLEENSAGEVTRSGVSPTSCLGSGRGIGRRARPRRESKGRARAVGPTAPVRSWPRSAAPHMCLRTSSPSVGPRAGRLAFG